MTFDQIKLINALPFCEYAKCDLCLKGRRLIAPRGLQPHAIICHECTKKIKDSLKRI